MLGGPWNSPGRRVIYAAETSAGAMLEMLANSNIGRMPKHHVWIEILIVRRRRCRRSGCARGSPLGRAGSASKPDVW